MITMMIEWWCLSGLNQMSSAYLKVNHPSIARLFFSAFCRALYPPPPTIQQQHPSHCLVNRQLYSVSQCASARQSAPDIQDSILKSACLCLSDHMVEWNYWKWVVLVLHNPHASPSFVQSFFMFRSPISFGGWIDHQQQAESNREIITSNWSLDNEKEGSELSRRENWNEICNRIVYYYQLKTITLEMKKFHCTQQQPQHLGDS